MGNDQICAGGDTTKEDKESQPEWKCEKTITEVHRSSNWGWFWILVHGFLKLSESFESTTEGTYSMLTNQVLVTGSPLYVCASTSDVI